jgi:hypothetical protein
MGLDMFAYTCDADSVGDRQVDIETRDEKGNHALANFDRDFAYWRKFNHLHGWMHQLYARKGGTSEAFNCNTVRLMPEDINVLESLATLKALPAKQGFFFGSGEPFDDDDKESVLDFVAKSRVAFSEGKAVIYDSWW